MNNDAAKRAARRIEQARLWAISNQPFYGSLAMNLQDRITGRVPTAATDGETIHWNPAFMAKMTDKNLRFILLHETLHCAHQHPWRLPITSLGNQAGDHEINLILKTIEGIEMPEGGLADPQYQDLACEEILRRLQDDQQEEDPDDGDDGDEPDGGEEGGSTDPGDGEQGEPSEGQNSDDDQSEGDDQSDGQSGQGDSQDGEDESEGQSSGGGKGSQDSQGDQNGQGDGQGDQSDSDDGDGDESGEGDPCGSFTSPITTEGDPAAAAEQKERMRDSWEGKVIQAAQVANAMGQGDIPADMQRVLDRLNHTTVDWRNEMVDFVKSALATRNDWSRSSRRHAWQKVIYPRRVADGVSTVIFVRDTSGSINNEICAQFTALITDCVSEMGCQGVVIDCDATIQAEYQLDGYEDCPLTAKGGGGTDFRPPFTRADELIEEGEQIAGVVYLTDLLGPFPEESDIPTLWLHVPSRYYRTPEPPFGRVVPVEM
jgi:predicted metal-dependent peptidase